MTENERTRLAAYLSGYVADVAEEWMRIIEIEEDILAPGSSEMQARVTWHEDRTFAVGEIRGSEEFGHYRVTVKVEPIEVPPIGPENDLGIYGIEETYDAAPEPTWAAAEWRWVVPGDRVRLGQQEATVTARHLGAWHAHVESKQLDGGRWWDVIRSFEHLEVTVRLEHLGDKALTFPPSGPVEILCDADRASLLLVQAKLNATEEAWPAAAGEWNRKALAAAGQPGTFRQHNAAAVRTGPRERGSVWTRPETKGEGK